MNPNLLLAVATALAGFALKSTLAFGFCLGLSWLTGSPGKRFLIWLSFLYGTAAYWLWLAKGVLVVGQRTPSTPQTGASTAHAWQIPGSWVFPLGVALHAVGIAYLLVLSYMLFAHVQKLRQLRRILGFASQPPDEIAEVFRPLAESLHARGSRLLVLSGIMSPATFGWIHPTIVLPELCLEEDRWDLEDILRHELHHVRRWDFVWNACAVVSRALVSFHPAAWYAARKMQVYRELACDLAVVSDSPTRRAKYADCLMRFARLSSGQGSRTWGIDFATPSDHLTARVHSILAETKDPSAWLVWSRSCCGMALLAGFVSIAPSLGVLFTYADQGISQRSTTEIRTGPSRMEVRIKRTKRRPSSTNAEPVVTDGAGVPTIGAESPQPTVLSAESKTGGFSPASSAGPQLARRGSAASAASGNGAKQQTVVLIDSDTPNQGSKSGDHDRSRALERSATAAADLYEGLSELDRH